MRGNALGRAARRAGPAEPRHSGGLRAGDRTMTADMGAVEVLRPGPFATIQDLGRTGYAAVGVPLSGAADLRSFALANALVGNPPAAATIEATFGGLELRAHRPVVMAVTGAPCLVTIDGSTASFGAAFSVEAGEVVQVGSPRRGLRTYL